MFDLKRLFAPLEGVNLEGLEIYVVGGAVRDSLLGLTPKDIDFVAVGTTRNIPRTRLPAGRTGFPVFLHPENQAEIALARTERKTKKGHKGFVVHADPSVALKTDLLRRDFTINAMALSPGILLTHTAVRTTSSRDNYAMSLEHLTRILCVFSEVFAS